MICQTRVPAVLLLVALVLFVGAPPSLLALDRPVYSGNAAGYTPGNTSSAPEMVSNEGDPDDWASNTGEGEGEDGSSQGQTGNDNAKWRDYLNSILDLLLGIKMELAGIL